jgi:hypothetical protein
LEGEVNQLVPVGQHQLQIGVVRTYFGPELPPALLWERNYKLSTLSLLYNDIQMLVFQFSHSFALSKSDWKGRLTQHDLVGSAGLMMDRSYSSPVGQKKLSVVLQRRVARALCFDSAEGPTEDPPVIFSATPPPTAAKRKRGKGKEIPTPFVDTGLRRSKRTCVAQAGYRPRPSGAGTPLSAVASSKKVAVKQVDSSDDANGHGQGGNKNEEIIPKTPIYLLQKVGKELEIDPEEISKEKLKAAPKARKSKKCPNDK